MGVGGTHRYGTVRDTEAGMQEWNAKGNPKWSKRNYFQFVKSTIRCTSMECVACHCRGIDGKINIFVSGFL